MPPTSRSRPDPFVSAAAIFAALPVVVAGIRAILDGWIPIGDNAVVEMRARDVLTNEHPWLGTWSSASIQLGVDVNHPGPIVFDVLALPVRLLGAGPGVVVGVMAINVAAIVAIAVVAYRTAGRLASVLASLAAACLSWVMGSELLFDPWNPHVAMLPFLATLVAAWAIADRRWSALPVFVGFGSICLQSHLGYVYVVPAIGLGALATAWWTGSGGAVRHPTGRGLRNAWIVLTVLWIQPVLEQLAGGGRGNLAQLLAHAGQGDAPSVGLGPAVRLVAAVAVGAPWDARAGFATIDPSMLVDGRGAALRWVGLTLALVVAAIVARRRGDTRGLVAVGVAAISVGVGVAAATIMPVTTFGLSAHQVRWLWPLAVWSWVAVLLVVVPALLDIAGERPPVRTAGAAVLLAACAAVAVATVPRYVQPSGPAADAWRMDQVAALVDQLDGIGRGPFRVDHDAVPFGDAYSAAVLAKLDAEEVGLRFVDEGLVRQYGSARRFNGREVGILRFRYGPDAITVTGNRIAVVDGGGDPGLAVAVYVDPLG